MAFGIAQGFGLEKAVERQLLEELKGQEEVARWIVNFAYSFLRTTKGGLIAGFGVLLLFLTVVKVMKDVEKAFNAIWKTGEERSISRTISDYITIIIIAPILLITSSSLTVFITTQVNAVTNQALVFEYTAPLLLPVLKLLPYFVIWGLLAFLYVSMPNTRVNFPSALLGGIIAGTIFQIFQWAYITFQVGVSKYNAIYGSFAALPLFIIWLQTSWLIVLLGAEISHAHQNSGDYRFDHTGVKISHNSKMLLELNVCYLIIRSFERGDRGCTPGYISRTLQIPMPLARETIQELMGAGLICATNANSQQGRQSITDGDQLMYQPALPADRFSIQYVIECLESYGDNDLLVNTEEGFKKIAEKVNALGDTLEKAPANILLKDL